MFPMNTDERAELNRLKVRFESMASEVDSLRQRIEQLERRRPVTRPEEDGRPGASPVAATAVSSVAIRMEPDPLPPPFLPRPLQAASVGPGLPVASEKPLAGKPKAVISTSGPDKATPAPEPPSECSTRVVPQEAVKGSFEMRLGTYWLVRVGVVMVLTAMVFFGKYAYQHMVAPMGPAGKVFLLYLASGALLALGRGLQRRVESLRNYGQVLFAGGLAAVYFTTYAAHHVPNLRVIESAAWSGFLLLAWAGYMVWLADRQKSELLSLFAIGLAFYTSIITHAGLFTLYSNLLLTFAALFFLLRNRWASLSIAALVASYAGYAFWRFYAGEAGHGPARGENLWIGIWFLACYWSIFTGVVFLSRDRPLTGNRRVALLSFNNGAFFVTFLLTLLHADASGFWQFALIYGAILTALSVVAARVLPDEPGTRSGYLLQGVLLITIGFIARFSGPSLGLILAAESAVLIFLAGLRRSLLLESFGCGVALLATFWTVLGMEPFNSGDLLLGGGVGALLLFNALSLSRRDDRSGIELRPGPTLFVTLSLLVWLVTTLNNTPNQHRPVVLALEAVLFTAAFYLVRMRELPLLGQGYLLLAHMLWLAGSVGSGSPWPWWNPLIVLAVSLALSHWWQGQRSIVVPAVVSQVLQGLYGMAIVLVLHIWLQPHFSQSTWLVMSALLACGVMGYAALTRAWLLMACGQVLIISMIWQFARQLLADAPAWHVAAVPVFVLLLVGGVVTAWLSRLPTAGGVLRQPVLTLALLYRWTALLMGMAWIHEYIPLRERVWVLLLTAAVVFTFAGWRRNRESLVAAAVLAVAGMLQFWLQNRALVVYVPNLLAILLFLSAQQAGRRWPERFQMEPHWHNLMIVLGGLMVWHLTSAWVQTVSGGFFLVMAWTAVALVLFLAGFALRERVYRWVGLGVLGCAMGRVVLLDVWKLEVIYRTLSFLALGMALLVLGFLYNRYQDRIRQWL
jgi:uncharacterized membrane protein